MNIDPSNPLVLIVTLTAMVLAIHLNTSWKLKRLTERLKKLENCSATIETAKEENE